MKTFLKFSFVFAATFAAFYGLSWLEERNPGSGRAVAIVLFGIGTLMSLLGRVLRDYWFPPAERS